MNPYTITALSPNAAEIRIDGPIGESLWQESVSARAFIAELPALKGKTLTVYVNSAGGSVMDATAIYNALQRHDQPVNVTVDGWALSAASLIAVAGQTLTLGTGSLLMLHNPSTLAEGTAADLRKSADLLDVVCAQMRSAYAAKSGADEATVAAWMDAETWFTADQAIAIKLADGKTAQTAAPAPVPTTAHFRNLPAVFAHLIPQESPMTPETPPRCHDAGCSRD